MSAVYDDGVNGASLPSRAIYPSRFLPYIVLLATSKFFQAFGIYLSYDLLKLVHVVQFLFFVKSGAAVFFIFMQKPFSSGRRISKREWFRIGRHAAFGCVLNLLWLFGLTLCGPLRTLMLFEHSDMVIIAGASALFTNTGGPSKFRGAVFFLLAVLGILLFDHDDMAHHQEELADVHNHHSVLTHLFDHMTNLTGLSDHKGGVVLLFATLCLQTGYNSAARKLSVDVGGSKRLHALSTFVSSMLLFPWTVVIFYTKESQVISWMAMLVAILLVVIMVFVADFYVTAACTIRLEQFRTAKVSTTAVFCNGIILTYLWNHPIVSHLTTRSFLNIVAAEDHVLSGGVVFSFVLFMFATHILTSPTKSSKGSLIGYSAAGLPLYSFTADALQKQSHSMFLILRNGFRQILEESDSRKIFYFLCINLSFTFVELVYGVWTNSLGLISDGFHMLFDCSALVMGLYAAVMTRWAATRIFSYGYDRVEILSGFVNALFLMVIAFFVFTAAITRIFDPPEIHTERLLAVSVAGLCVNLIGIMAFRHGHSHGVGGHGHSHGGHGHSHGAIGAHGHSHKPQGHAHSQGSDMAHNTNMEGVFLHVLADTLGSVGVIISTLLIENFNWKVADPICSIFISVLIFVSVIPLIKETVLILLLRTPEKIQKDIGLVLQKLLASDGVISYRDEHFWRHSSKVMCGTIHILVKQDISEQKIVSLAGSLFREIGMNNFTVQVEKESYFQHLSGLGQGIDQVYELTKTRKTLPFDIPSSYTKAM